MSYGEQCSESNEKGKVNTVDRGRMKGKRTVTKEDLDILKNDEDCTERKNGTV